MIFDEKIENFWKNFWGSTIIKSDEKRILNAFWAIFEAFWGIFGGISKGFGRGGQAEVLAGGVADQKYY